MRDGSALALGELGQQGQRVVVGDEVHLLAVAQADQPVSGLLAVAVSYVFTFFCSFISFSIFVNLFI